MTVFQRISEIICSILGVKIEQLCLETNISDLGADSLDWTDIVVEVEEEFDIFIEDKDADNFQTIQDIIQYLKKQGLQDD
jgi:acyl carrier protein